MTHIVTCCWEEGEIWVSFPKQRLWKLKPGQHIKVHLTKTSDGRLQLQDNHTYIQTPRRELIWWGNTLADIKTQVESGSRWKKTGHQGKNMISLTISLYWGFFNNDFYISFKFVFLYAIYFDHIHVPHYIPSMPQRTLNLSPSQLHVYILIINNIILHTLRENTMLSNKITVEGNGGKWIEWCSGSVVSEICCLWGWRRN